MSDEMFEVIDIVEIESGNLELIQTILTEMGYDLDKVITFDGSKEDDDRKRNLLNRQKTLSNFLTIATDILLDSVKNLKTAIDIAYGKGGA